jgi:hypothetical protein
MQPHTPDPALEPVDAQCNGAMLDSWVVGYGERVPFVWYAFSQLYSLKGVENVSIDRHVCQNVLVAHLYHAFLQLPFSGGLLLRLTEFILPPLHPSVKEIHPRGVIPAIPNDQIAKSLSPEPLKTVFSGRTTTTIHDPDAAADTCNLGTVERMLWHAGQGGGHTAGHMRNVPEESDAVRLLHRPRGCQPQLSVLKRQAQKLTEHKAQRTKTAWLGPRLRLSPSIHESPANQGLQAIQNRITLLTLILTQKARHLTLALPQAQVLEHSALFHRRWHCG